MPLRHYGTKYVDVLREEPAHQVPLKVDVKFHGLSDILKNRVLALVNDLRRPVRKELLRITFNDLIGLLIYLI